MALSSYVQEVRDRMSKGESYESATKAASQGRTVVKDKVGDVTYGERSSTPTPPTVSTPKTSSSGSSGGSTKTTTPSVQTAQPTTTPTNSGSNITVPKPGSSAQDFENYALSKYNYSGGSLTSAQKAELTRYAHEMSTRGNSSVPSFLQSGAQSSLERDWNNSLNDFYNKVVKNNPSPEVQHKWNQLKSQWDAMPEGQKDPTKLTPTSVGNYKGFDVTNPNPAGREYNFDWQTGKSTGNLNLASPDYNLAMDQRYGQMGNMRDQIFNDMWEMYVATGQMANTPENKAWFMGLKDQWSNKMSEKYDANGVAIGSQYTYQPSNDVPADPLKNLVNALRGTHVTPPQATTSGIQNISTAPQPASAQFSGTDYNAEFVRALNNGDFQSAANALQQRAYKLRSMGVDPNSDPTQLQLSQAFDAVVGSGMGQPTTSAAVPAQAPVGGTGTMSEQEQLRQLITELTNEDYQAPEQFDYRDAQRMATDQLGGEYDKAQQELARLMDIDAERRGIFNSPMAAGITADKVGDLQTEREAKIAQLAQQIMAQENATNLQRAQMAQSYKQEKLGNLTNLLNYLANRDYQDAQLTGVYKGNQTLEARQIETDNYYKSVNAELQRASLTGEYQGNPTLAGRAAALQEYSTRLDSALARAQQFGKVTTQEDAMILGVPVGSATFAAQEAALDRKMQYAQIAASRAASNSSNVLANFTKDLQVAELTGKFPNTPAMQQYGLAGQEYTGDAKQRAAKAAQEAEDFQVAQLSNAATQLTLDLGIDKNSAKILAYVDSVAANYEQAYNLLTTDANIKSEASAIGVNVSNLLPILRSMYGTAAPAPANGQHPYEYVSPSGRW